jgi:4-amino-4-deoxy-L-arabinose transferase-like glycosyltransferase
MIGGVFLFLLVRDLVSFEGAIVSTAYYLFFPYAVIASRSFQPDPLMVMMILGFWWMFARWIRFPSWINALLAGLLGGLAIYIKFSAAFFVIGPAFGLALSRLTFRDLLRNAQVWLMAILGALPALIYLVYGVFIRGTLGGQFVGRFIPALLLSPLNYLQWMTKADLAAGGIFIMLALLGVLLAIEPRLRSFFAGLWISYLAYGLFFDYHIATHDYYHLPFIPIVAVSLSLLGGWFFARLTEATVHGGRRAAVYVILLFGLFSVLWNVRNQMKAVDYRPQAEMFAEVGEILKDERIVALTQDYGSRLEYWGWKSTFTWPSVGDLSYATIRGTDFSFDAIFEEQTSKKDFFLVTDFEELGRQPELEARLSTYPVYARGNGYIIYQLQEQR